MSKKNESGAVAEMSNASTAVAMTAEMMGMMAADAGMGMEGADRDSYAIPFLSVLQGLSPQLETVDGAKPGLLINTVTNDLFASIEVVPVAFQRRFLRWVPREDGGGFKGEMSVAEVDELRSSGRAIMDEETGSLKFEGDILKDTRIHYVLLLTADGLFNPAVISCAGTQVKKSKRWMGLINSVKVKGPHGLFTPPSFSHRYVVSTAKEKNDKGSWYSFSFENAGPVQSVDVYQAAKEFHKQINAGNVKVQTPHDEGESAEGAGREGF